MDSVVVWVYPALIVNYTNKMFIVLAPGQKNNSILKPGSPYWRENISTIDFLVLTSSDQLFLMLKNIFFSYLQNTKS